jgi:hypothetical protein
MAKSGKIDHEGLLKSISKAKSIYSPVHRSIGEISDILTRLYVEMGKED